MSAIQPMPPAPPSHPPPREMMRLSMKMRFDITYRHRSLGLDLTYEDGCCVVVSDGGGALAGDVVMSIEGVSLDLPDERTFRNVILRLQQASRPVRLTFERVGTDDDEEAGFYELQCGGMGCRGNDARRGRLELELASGARVRIGLVGVLLEGRSVIVVDGNVEGDFPHGKKPRRGDSLLAVSGSFVRPQLNCDVRRAIEEAQRGWVASGEKLKIAFSRTSTSLHTVGMTSSAAAGLFLSNKGLLRVATSTAVSAAGSVVLALNATKVSHLSPVAFACLAKEQEATVGVTFAAADVAVIFKRPTTPAKPTTPAVRAREVEPLAVATPVMGHHHHHRRAGSVDRASWTGLSAPERRCLAQLRRVLRASVGAELYEVAGGSPLQSRPGSTARRNTRPRMVCLHELGDFEGLVIAPLLGSCIALGWSEMTAVEMPMTPHFGVDDATLAASFTIKINDTNYDIATDSGALAYLLADGVELARRAYNAGDPVSWRQEQPPEVRPTSNSLYNRGNVMSTVRVPSLIELNGGRATSFWRQLHRGLIVEVAYAEGTYTLRSGGRGANMSAGNLFHPGEYCLATVVRRERKQAAKRGHHKYVLKYRDGPYDEETNARTRHKLPKGTTFHGVPRDCIVVTYERQSRYYPWALLLISAAQVGCFFYFAQRKPGGTNFDGPVIGPRTLWYWVTGPFPGCNDGRGQIWRLFAYQLAHSGYYHLFSNVVLQIVYGFSVEAVHGHFKLLLVYQLGVAVGALTCAFSDIHRAVIGASGGLYTLIGLHTADILVNHASMGNYFKAFARALFCFVVPATDILVYLLIVHDSSELSYSAHVGGYVAGLLLGLSLLTPIIARPSYSLCIRPLAVILLIVYVGFSVIWWGTNFPPRFFLNGAFWQASSYNRLDDDPNCCWQLLECEDIDADQYRQFNCQDGRDLTWPFDQTDTKIETCSALLSILVSDGSS